MKDVTFRNRDWDVAGQLHFPPDFDEKRRYPAIVVAHPISSCKEQTASIYARRLAEEGYVTLTFDASYQGASGGNPRFIEDPATRVEDFRCAADFLVTLAYVDDARIGVMGICGGGAYAVNAAMTERRFKAVASVVAANYGRIMREGDLSPDAAIRTLEAIANQRSAEARGGEALVGTYIPNSQEEREAAAIDDIDLREAIDYYKTPRGAAAGSPNKLRFAPLGAAMAFDAFHLADRLLTQPLQIIVGDVPGGFGSYRDGFELFDRARSSMKNIHVVKGASHYDLYDRPGPVAEATGKLVTFFNDNL